MGIFVHCCAPTVARSQPFWFVSHALALVLHLLYKSTLISDMRHMWTLKIKNQIDNWFTIESLVNWKSMHSTTMPCESTSQIDCQKHTDRRQKQRSTHAHIHMRSLVHCFRYVILSTLWLYSLKHANILGALHTNTWPSQVYFIFCLVLYFFQKAHAKIKYQV